MRNRVASLDILKIVSIFFIVIHHYALWTKWNFPSGFSLDKLTVQTMLIGGKLGVNIFVMITGYFMIHSSVKLKSIVQIWLETTIISLIIYFF
ncbi:acyltransferase family protein, partial [Enterococcus gallinarum]